MANGDVWRARRLIQLPALAEQHNRRLVYSVFVFLAAGTAIGIIAAVAYESGRPLVVPSLGPTAFLVFNRSESASARPRNIVAGHLVGVVAGYVALSAFHLVGASSVLTGGVSASRIGAAALSIALTCAVMVLLRVEHGPAGATTLIVSLGFMTSIASLAMLMTGVVGLTIVAIMIDRLVGIPIPLWSCSRAPSRALTRRRSLPRGLSTTAVSRDGDGNARDRGQHGVSAESGSLRFAVPAGVARDGTVEGLVVEAGVGRRVFVGAGDCTVKVEEAASAGAYSLLELTLDPRRPSSLLHSHYDFAESYYVLEGRVVAELGAERRHAGPGSTIHIPAGMPHLLTPMGQRPARLLCVTNHARQSDLEFLP